MKAMTLEQYRRDGAGVQRYRRVERKSAKLGRTDPMRPVSRVSDSVGRTVSTEHGFDWGTHDQAGNRMVNERWRAVDFNGNELPSVGAPRMRKRRTWGKLCPACGMQRSKAGRCECNS